MEIKRREGESISAFLYRFSKNIKRSGILREFKKRRHHSRPVTKTKRRASALYREQKKKELEKINKF